MTAACPKCGGVELYVHASRTNVSFSRAVKSLFLRKSLRMRSVGVDVSCCACFFQFTARESGAVPAMRQPAHEAHAAATGLALVKGKGRESSDDETAQAPRATPRPAPDPRNRKR